MGAARKAGGAGGAEGRGRGSGVFIKTRNDRPTHPLGIGVWDASRLIDPRNPTSPGGVHPLMDGHPHRCSTDFEQTLLGGHLT